MNKFDLNFFSKYTPEWQEIKAVIHIHPIKLLLPLTMKIFLFVIVPVVFYISSYLINSIIPFFLFEIYLFLVFIKLIYDIFDWYNDVWIITDSAIVSLTWSFLKANSDTINFENIEWVWVEAVWIFDKIFRMWTLSIHKIWDDSITLEWAIKPYKAVDLIEQIMEETRDDQDEDKFDIIMDALSGVVGDYLHENKIKEKTKEEAKEKIEKFKIDENTIDLR